MAYLFFNELGNRSVTGVYGNGQEPFEFLNLGPFKDVILTSYWSGTEVPEIPELAFMFNNYIGCQDVDVKESTVFAFAVHDGDVGAAATVPIPPAFLLTGSGLAGLGFLRRRFFGV